MRINQGRPRTAALYAIRSDVGIDSTDGALAQKYSVVEGRRYSVGDSNGSKRGLSVAFM